MNHMKHSTINLLSELLQENKEKNAKYMASKSHFSDKGAVAKYI